MAHRLADLVGEVIAPGARVLEIGAAGGQDATYLRSCGLEVFPTDASAAFVTHLRTHGFPEAARFDLRHDDPPPGPWDVVFANAVLPHLRRRDVPDALRRLLALGPETILMASVKIGEGEGWSTQKLGTLRWYTYWQPDEFIRVLDCAGWSVEEAWLRTGRYDDWVCVVAQPRSASLRDAFEDRAATYGECRWHREFARQLVALTPLERGWSIVDAACGTGSVARAAAPLLGPEGHVLAVDFAEAMLTELVAEQRRDAPAGTSDELGPVAPIVPLQGDANDLPVPDGAVDAVLCGASLRYLDPDRALRDWHRALRPGGVVAFSEIATAQPPAWALFRSHASAYGLDITDPTIKLGTPTRCEQALRAAGFTDVRVSSGTLALSESDLDHAWDVPRRMLRGRMAALPDEDVARLRASFEAEMRLLRRTDPTFRVAHTLYAVGRRP